MSVVDLSLRRWSVGPVSGGLLAVRFGTRPALTVGVPLPYLSVRADRSDRDDGSDLDRTEVDSA